MKLRTVIRIAATTLIVVAIGYIYAREVIRNWASLQQFRLVIRIDYLLAALALYLVASLVETYAWQISINKHRGRQELSFAKSIAVVHSSRLMKYLPGKIWTYTAQAVWLTKYGVSKPVTLYVNLICIVGSITVSLYLGLIYVALYSALMSPTTMILVFAAAVLLNLVYIKWNAPIINWLIAVLARYLKREIAPLKDSAGLIALIQLAYMCSVALGGVGAYLLAQGIGLRIPSADIFAVVASISLSWLAGYLAVIVPGGLGVREGVMLSMLHSIVDTQTALIFPIVSRLLTMLTELILGAVSLWIGMKYKVFSAAGVEPDR